jgi:hypothetical protein
LKPKALMWSASYLLVVPLSGKRCGELLRGVVLGSGIDFCLEPGDVVLAGQHFKQVPCGIAVTAVGKLLKFVDVPLSR